MKVYLLILLGFLASPVLGAEEPLKLLFLGGGSGAPNSGHNGRINHHKLIPEFLRAGIHLTYSDRKEDLNEENLAQYEVVLLYIGGGEKKEEVQALVSYVENGGGVVAVHHTCGAYKGDKDFVNLIGGEFARHGEGWFTARHTDGRSRHPALGGVREFEAWDETFAHKNLNADRIDLQVRMEKDGHPEPWTWVRTQGKGRVFYTAHGHDHQVWETPEFQQMMTSAAYWTANQTPQKTAGIPPFQYTADTEEVLHNYEERRAVARVQEQLTPEQSAQCLVMPEGFQAQLIAHEPDIVNPIDLIWDDQGRMYVAVTEDYPTIKEQGNDKIILCEDTNGDGVMDTFKVFAEGFSLHTGMCWVDGGIILAAAPDMYFLKDTDGDDKADVVRKINTGWGIGDLHGGPSNLRYGLDNKVYGCIGGGGYESEAGFFSGGIWRMERDGSEVTPISSVGGNSWALGISEDFELFSSAANKAPAKHIYAPYPYFDEIGLKKVPAASIFDFHTIYPLALTRQGDHFGSYTSGAGFDLYTARSFPAKYWNQAGFIGSPTGKLLGQFFLEPDQQGSYRARNSGSLVASFDEYTAPIRGVTGPDGSLYMLDWNNLIMLHGGHLDNPLRDKTHGRIYKVTHQDGKPSPLLNLKGADTQTLVQALTHENMFWRTMAQEKIVSQKRLDAVPALVTLAQDASVDAVGLNPAVIHALWTLHGLGVLDGSNAAALQGAYAALSHRSAGVRKNAARVLPPTEESREILASLLNEKDANALRYILLSLSTMPPSAELGEQLYSLKGEVSGKKFLNTPLQLALIKHGSSLVEPILAKLPARDREREGAQEEAEVEMENLIRNPSFEHLEAGMPDKWIAKVHNGAAQLRVDSEVTRTGKSSARMDSTEGGGAEFLMIPSLEPGEYMFSAWVKTKDVEGKNGVLLRAFGPSVEEVQTEGLKGTHEEWKQLKLTFKVTKTRGVLLFCLFGAWSPTTGTAWFDDVELYQLSSEKVPEVKPAQVETLLGKEAFSKGAETILRITELVEEKSEESSAIFMEGLRLVEQISFTEEEVQDLAALAQDAAPKNQEHLAIFARNNGIDIGLAELANKSQGFQAKVQAGDKEEGKLLSKACVACHGSDFLGIPEQRAPSLSQFSDTYLQTQLQKFKHGVRGGSVNDANGYIMHTLVKPYTHEEIAALSAYITHLPSTRKQATLGGDPVRGADLYKACAACHQANGQGNDDMSAPGLVGLSDAYIVEQLKKFHLGVRGSGTGDLSGKLMQLSVSGLIEEQDRRDLAAYLTSLPVSAEED